MARLDFDFGYYEGEVKNGKPNGKGVFYSNSGTVYEGECVNGKKHGQGTMFWPSGDVYSGGWKNDLKCGFGTYDWPCGEKYVGEWNDDKFHGYGTYYYESGNRYEGEWKNDLWCGCGVFYTLDAKFVGRFKDGEPCGNFNVYFANGDMFVGKFKGFSSQGIGCMYFADDTKKQGEYIDGEFIPRFKSSLKVVDGTLYVPEGTSIINDSEFMGCVDFNSVEIPDSVKSIGDCAFCDCVNLKSVSIGKGVESIDWNAFMGCKALENIMVAEGNSTYTSQDGVLYNVAKNRIHTVPEGIKGHIVILDGITRINCTAFANCTNLTGITVPDSVTSTDSFAFENTAWFNNQPDGVVYVGKVVYTYKGEMPDGTSIEIKEGTLGIGDEAFGDCEGLTNITIPDSVTSIGCAAFYGCENLTSVTIPDSVTKIGEDAFSNCTSLEKVIFPKSVKFVDVLKACDETPWLIAWYNSQPNGMIYVDNVAYCYKNGYDETTAETSVTIKEGTVEIGAYAFAKCIYLENVTIPDSVVEVAVGAFLDCQSLERIDVAENNEKYASKDGILYNKSDKSIHTVPKCIEGEVTLLYGITEIDAYEFSGRDRLSSVTIPNSVNRIHADAFVNCGGISIRFEGTKLQWQRINFYKREKRLKTGVDVVYCNDGIIRYQ